MSLLFFEYTAGRCGGQPRGRESKRKQDADTDLALRATLDPPLKAWCEEYGKKRNVRALLGTMHVVYM